MYIEHDKRRKTYCVRWREDGKKQRDDQSYDRKQDAETRLRILIKEGRDESLGRKTFDHSLIDSLTKYVEDLKKRRVIRAETAYHELQQFAKYMKDRVGKEDVKISSISRVMLLDYYSDLIGRGLAEWTAKSYMVSVSAWYRWAVAHEHIGESPYKEIKVKTPPRLDRYLTDQELSDLEQAIRDKEYLTMFRIGYSMGLRPGEIRRIRDIDILWDARLNKGELSIPVDETKTDSGGRIIPLPPEIYQDLPRRTGRLFPWTEQRMKRNFNAAKLRAGIQPKIVRGRTVHKFFYWTRHTYAKRYLERGGSLRILSTLMGHASISITADTYGHMERAKIQECKVPLISAVQSAGQVPLDQKIAGHWRGTRPEMNQNERGNMAMKSPNTTINHTAQSDIKYNEMR